MARKAPPSRVADLAAAATKVFTEKGYRRALMSDVAAELGVSPGTLYRYVDGKEALFHFVFAYEVAEGHIDEGDLPMARPLPGETLELVSKRLVRGTGVPRLRDALSRDVTDNAAAELAGIIEERYMLVARNWRIHALIEKSAVDIPELFEMYFVRGRRRLSGGLARYLEKRTEAGYFRRVGDIATVARLIEEGATWFAWHRHGDPDTAGIDDDVARRTVVDTFVAALVAA